MLNKYPIIPNRNGDFKKLEELYSDIENPIPDSIINIYDKFIADKKLNGELIKKEIDCEYLGDVLKKKDFIYITRKINSFILENKDLEKTKKVAYKLLSIESDKEEINKIYGFLSFFII